MQKKDDISKNQAAVELGRLGGKKGGPARAKKISKERRSEIARAAAHARWKGASTKGGVMYTWEHTLTASEALRPNQGAEMPFLRFTKEGMQIDHTTWYRSVMFQHAPWRVASVGEEIAHISVAVTICGKPLGLQQMELSYKPSRAVNNSAPTVHLNYNGVIEAELKLIDVTSKTVKVTANGNSYSLEIF